MQGGQGMLLSQSYSFCCAAQQTLVDTTIMFTQLSYSRPHPTLEPSCSHHSLSFPSKKSLLLGSSRCPSRGFNLVRRCSSRLASGRSISLTRRRVVTAVASPNSAIELSLTEENVETVLDEVRPYLIADGGNVALHEIDGNIVQLKLQGACGSCPSSVTTMKLGIERRLMEKIPEIVAVEVVPDEETGLELNEENIEKKFQPDNNKQFLMLDLTKMA